MFRRDFIRLASLAGGVFALPDNLRSFVTTNDNSDKLYEIFSNPSAEYRPFVRWWWNGDRLQSAELLRELDVLKAAGIGGVEINPIKFPSSADPMNIPSLTYLSDEWIDMLKIALNGAKERGIICDMIVGSGWPYGGEFLTRDDQCQMVALGTRNLEGGAKVQLSEKELVDSVHPAFVSAWSDPLKELIAAYLVPAEMKDITQSKEIHLAPSQERETITIDVPAGPHVLYYLIKITGFAAVIQGAPGAAGPVLNHYDAAAVERYLDRIESKLTPKLGKLGDHFRALFTDSIELEGANWCNDLFEQFKKVKGYDLKPWLPFVLFKVGEMGNAVQEAYGAQYTPELQSRIETIRYDFETLKRYLFQERFIKTFADWCTRNGVKSRMQAYGMDCDPITSGMMVDIPECETWIWTEAIDEFGTGDYRKGRNYTMINKFVSSSAHLSGKRLVSCEEMTNTDDPFHGTLERIKLAGDQSMLSGVTGSVLHGFNYTPLEAPFPGWIRYGSFFNERNPWWPWFHLWADYKARLSAVFQQCDMQAAVAVLHPMADLAAKYGFQRDPYPVVTYPSYAPKIWEAIHQNGHGCDYLSEEVISQSTVNQKGLTYKNRTYKAILLAEVETIQLSTAKALGKFAAAGGKIIFIGKTPHLSAGMVDHQKRSAQIKTLMESVIKKHPTTTGIEAIDEANLVDWFGKLADRYKLTPEVKISHPVDYMSTLHYSNGEHQLYFFSNYSGTKTNTFEATFPEGNKPAWIWDAETGERRPYPSRQSAALKITLGPTESKLIVFSPETPPAVLPSEPASELATLLPGPWEVTLHHVNGVTRTITVNNLTQLSEDKDWMTFAGTIEYRARFHSTKPSPTNAKPSPAKQTWIGLGRLRDLSRLELNGRPIGTKWHGEHLYDITSAIVDGDNYLTIQVITTLGNYMKTLKDNKTAREWTSRSPYYPAGLKEVTLVTF
ncbi:MAG: hypothetical protein JST68_27930 [Bacteroidetes bacterium]|nr:hypothetical protein [Bacteroidota bacterium]